MKHSYTGTQLTIQAERGERVSYRKQSLCNSLNTEAFTDIPIEQSVSLNLNEHQMEWVEIKTEGKSVACLPPREDIKWEIVIECKKTKGGGIELRVKSPTNIHLSHIYMDVGGKKVYLSRGRATADKVWYLDKPRASEFYAEDYCRDFVDVSLIWN